MGLGIRAMGIGTKRVKGIGIISTGEFRNFKEISTFLEVVQKW